MRQENLDRIMVAVDQFRPNPQPKSRLSDDELEAVVTRTFELVVYWLRDQLEMMGTIVPYRDNPTTDIMNRLAAMSEHVRTFHAVAEALHYTPGRESMNVADLVKKAVKIWGWYEDLVHLAQSAGLLEENADWFHPDRQHAMRECINRLGMVRQRLGITAPSATVGRLIDEGIAEILASPVPTTPNDPANKPLSAGAFNAAMEHAKVMRFGKNVVELNRKLEELDAIATQAKLDATNSANELMLEQERHAATKRDLERRVRDMGEANDTIDKLRHGLKQYRGRAEQLLATINDELNPLIFSLRSTVKRLAPNEPAVGQSISAFVCAPDSAG